MSTITNTLTTQILPEQERIVALIQRLRVRHVKKYGTEKRYLVRIGHRLGVTGKTVARWSRGYVLPRVKYVDRLDKLDRQKDPFDYSHLSSHEKVKPGNHAPGKV